MHASEDIPIKIAQPTVRTASRENALPLLHEIRHALDRLLATGESTVIDVEGIPMTAQDEKQLFEALGAGEVEARLETLGTSTIRETGISGVWVVAHSNVEGETIGRFIEVGFVPEILRSQVQDIREGLAQLVSVTAN